eukprot:1281757-Amphidinium_carterae.1
MAASGQAMPNAPAALRHGSSTMQLRARQHVWSCTTSSHWLSPVEQSGCFALAAHGFQLRLGVLNNNWYHGHSIKHLHS